jgi:hypothetical protein
MSGSKGFLNVFSGGSFTNKSRRGSVNQSLKPTGSNAALDNSSNDLSGGKSHNKSRRSSKTGSNLLDPHGLSASGSNKSRRGSIQQGEKGKLKSQKSFNDSSQSGHSKSRRESLIHDSSNNGRRTSISNNLEPMKPIASSKMTSRNASIFVNKEVRINPNLIMPLKEIHGEMHVIKMVHFCGYMTPNIKSPYDDVETLSVPDPAKNPQSLHEMAKELYSIACFQSYSYESNFQVWTESAEKLEDIYTSTFCVQADFDPKAAFNIILDCYSARARWKAQENVFREILKAVERPEVTATSMSREVIRPVTRLLITALGNSCWGLRKRHAMICDHIDKYFSKFSEQDWKNYNIPVVYGAFNNGVDVLGLFGMLRGRIPSMNLIKLKQW